jgi:hypothetical protein
VTWALFSCHSKINPPFQNPGSLSSIAAQFIERPFYHYEAAEGSRNNIGGYEITAHLSGARNDSGKQPCKSRNYKNLEVKHEENT